MSTDEEERFSKLLDSELERSIFRDNCDQGIDVEGALQGEINKRRTSTKNHMNNQSLQQLLCQNDPFETTVPSSDNTQSSSKRFFDRSQKASERQRPSDAKHLADVLLNEDPFAIVDAMTNVRNQFSSSSSVVQQSSKTYFRCNEECHGCSYCDGVDYINDIRIEQNIDDYEQAVEEEDGGLFFKTDDGLAVETDDDCVEYSKVVCTYIYVCVYMCVCIYIYSMHVYMYMNTTGTYLWTVYGVLFIYRDIFVFI